MLIFAWLFAAVAAEDSAVYTIAVRSPAGHVQKWATLEVDLEAPTSFEYTPEPHDGAKTITEGCLGVIGATGFECQTLFRTDALHQAVSALLNTDGSLIQARFVEGPRAKGIVTLPDQVPRPVLLPPARASGVRSQQKDAAQQDTQYAAEEEGTEKSFLEQYWIYALPVALLLMTNLITPSNAAQQE